MGDPAVILLLILLPALVVCSAFFSGSETALFSLTQHQRRALTRGEHVVATALRTLLAETRPLLITLLLGNMTVNVLYFVLSTVLLLRLERGEHLSATALAAASVTPLVVLILCGEVLPKLLAARLAQGFSTLVALPLLLVHRALTPLRATVNVLVITPLARLIAPSRAPQELSAQELEALLELSQQKGLIDDAEESLLQEVLTLGQLKVRDVMTPRVDVQAFDLDDAPEELLKLVRETRLSKIPVYRGDIDHIQGLVLSRQVLLRPPSTRQQVRQLIRQVQFVPELQRADQLLVHFRKSGQTFAIVVDEYGGTAGLVTIEDVVEEMVGPIAGPYEDSSEQSVMQRGPGRFRVSGALPLHEWQAFCGQVEGGEGLQTIGGLVMARLGRLPREGDRIQIGNVEIEVQRMEKARVRWLDIHLRGEAPAGGETP